MLRVVLTVNSKICHSVMVFPNQSDLVHRDTTKIKDNRSIDSQIPEELGCVSLAIVSQSATPDCIRQAFRGMAGLSYCNSVIMSLIDTLFLSRLRTI